MTNLIKRTLFIAPLFFFVSFSFGQEDWTWRDRFYCPSESSYPGATYSFDTEDWNKAAVYFGSLRINPGYFQLAASRGSEEFDLEHEIGYTTNLEAYNPDILKYKCRIKSHLKCTNNLGGNIFVNLDSLQGFASITASPVDHGLEMSKGRTFIWNKEKGWTKEKKIEYLASPPLIGYVAIKCTYRKNDRD